MTMWYDGEYEALQQRIEKLEAALGLACSLLAADGYDRDPDYTQEWQTISEAR